MAHGTLRTQFDPNQKIEILEFITSSHEEYVPRTRVIDAARPLHKWAKEWHKANAPVDCKQPPEMSKKVEMPTKSPRTAPPEIDIPESKVKLNMGITPSVFRFLEVSTTMRWHLSKSFVLTVNTARRSHGSDERTLPIFPSKSITLALSCIRSICRQHCLPRRNV